MEMNPMAGEPIIPVKHLDMGYGSFVLMRDLNFTVNRGDIFIIMGGSGCGKSTLLKDSHRAERTLTGASFLWRDEFLGRWILMSGSAS